MLVYQKQCIIAIHKNFRLSSRSIVNYIGHKPEFLLLTFGSTKENSLSIHKNPEVGESTISKTIDRTSL